VIERQPALARRRVGQIDHPVRGEVGIRRTRGLTMGPPAFAR
jgi:hypothetical protein